MKQPNEKGTQKDLVLYRIETAQSDIKAAEILLGAKEFRGANNRAYYGIYHAVSAIHLEVFLRNLLLNEKNELHNRNLHISGLLNEEKVDIGDSKVDIENEKVDVQDKKVDIESVLSGKGSDFSVKTTIHIHRLFERFGFDEVFGRSAVMELLELKGSGASKLLSNLVKADIIEPVSGHGKGRYKFKKRWLGRIN